MCCENKAASADYMCAIAILLVIYKKRYILCISPVSGCVAYTISLNPLNMQKQANQKATKKYGTLICSTSAVNFLYCARVFLQLCIYYTMNRSL